jgi:hypothetical protein
VPAAAKKAEPVWGIKGGIAVGLWPTPGPRGLFRIYTPYLGQPRLRMINFISVEPIVKGKRGLSELEKSALDRVAGKAMWTGNEHESDPKPRHPWEPARGKVIALDGTKALTFHVFLERFENGARPIIQVLLRQDRPHEIKFRVFSARPGADMDACVLSATMGNYARLRRIWLKDEVINAPKLWPKFQPDGWGFSRWHQWEVNRMRISDNIAVVAATANETDPSRATYASDVPRHWRYEGRRATQYWKAPVEKGMVVRVNGRKTFWATRAAIPGGVSYENFELKAPFRQGQEFRFGVISEGPEALGFK